MRMRVYGFGFSGRTKQFGYLWIPFLFGFLRKREVFPVSLTFACKPAKASFRLSSVAIVLVSSVFVVPSAVR